MIHDDDDEAAADLEALEGVARQVLAPTLRPAVRDVVPDLSDEQCDAVAARVLIAARRLVPESSGNGDRLDAEIDRALGGADG